MPDNNGVAFEPHIHLCVEIENEAGNMFVAAGKIKAFNILAKRELTSAAFDELDEAVKAAARSVANYKVAILHGRAKLTTEEWGEQ